MTKKIKKEKAVAKKVITTKFDIKDRLITLTEFKKWIADFIPQGISDDDVEISFNIDNYTGYYDEQIIDAEMQLSYLKKE